MVLRQASEGCGRAASGAAQVMVAVIALVCIRGSISAGRGHARTNIVTTNVISAPVHMHMCGDR